MQVEQVKLPYLSPSQKIDNFVAWANRRDLDWLFFDLDDTICDSRHLFRSKVAQTSRYLAKNSFNGFTPERWNQEMDTINNRLFVTHGVVPQRWNLVMDQLSFRYPIPEQTVRHSKGILRQIYTTPIHFLPGAEDGLNFAVSTHCHLAVVTHANGPWTWEKYQWLGLDGFVPRENVFIVDEHGHKTAESWHEAADNFHTRPQYCAVIGDSPRSDINAARQAGFNTCVLVPDPIQWSVHEQPVHPTTYCIGNLSQLADIYRLPNRGWPASPLVKSS